jgi:hypothetical protein
MGFQQKKPLGRKLGVPYSRSERYDVKFDGTIGTRTSTPQVSIRQSVTIPTALPRLIGRCQDHFKLGP